MLFGAVNNFLRDLAHPVMPIAQEKDDQNHQQNRTCQQSPPKPFYAYA